MDLIKVPSASITVCFMTWVYPVSNVFCGPLAILADTSLCLCFCIHSAMALS